MAISSYELLKKRLEARGGDQEGRIRKSKLDSLMKALKYSEQAETVIKDGVEYRAILNKNKQKMDYDDKNISIPFDANFKTGDVFHWVEDNSDWIVYLKEGQDAYFTGVCRKAIYSLRWKDDFGVYHTTMAATRGPVETKVVSEMKSGLSFDSPNYTLHCLVPNTKETKELKRYSRVSINERVWQITVVDDISEPGVLDIQLIEDYKNQIEDTELVKPSKNSCEFVPSENIKIMCSLDEVASLEMLEPFKLWVRVEKDGLIEEEVSEQALFRVEGPLGSIDKTNMLTAFEQGEVTIVVDIPRLCYSKKYVIPVTENDLPSISRYEIFGDDKVKSFGSQEYEIKLFVDGIVSEAEPGEWLFTPDKKLFSTTKSESGKSIVFNWSTGRYGSVKLQYAINNNVVAEKLIKVESLI